MQRVLQSKAQKYAGGEGKGLRDLSGEASEETADNISAEERDEDRREAESVGRTYKRSIQKKFGILKIVFSCTGI